MSMVAEPIIEPRDELTGRQSSSGLGAMAMLNLYLGDRLVLYQALAATRVPDWAVGGDDASGGDPLSLGG